MAISMCGVVRVAVIRVNGLFFANGIDANDLKPRRNETSVSRVQFLPL